MNENVIRSFERLYTLIEFEIDTLIDHQNLMANINDVYSHNQSIERCCKAVEDTKLSLMDLEDLENYIRCNLC